MADEEPESFIEQMTRETSLPLRAVGGRVFVNNADADNTDRCTIELKCWWSPGLLAMFDTDIRIGDHKHKPLKVADDGVEVVDDDAEEQVGWSLLDCPIMLSLYPVDEKWMAESAAKNGGKPILGRLNYYAPVQTADGVVNDKRPTITAWVGIGRGNFKLLRDRLVSTELPDFDIGITVEFPRGTVETGWVDKKVNWDGKGQLPVSGATIAWKRGDWDSDADHERQGYRPEEPEHYEPRPEHVELMQSVGRVEAAIAKLMLPVWLAAGAAIIALILAR